MEGIRAATKPVRFEDSAPADRSSTYPSSSTAASIRCRVSWETAPSLFSARETVMAETPARAATSDMVAGRLGAFLVVSPSSFHQRDVCLMCGACLFATGFGLPTLATANDT